MKKIYLITLMFAMLQTSCNTPSSETESRADHVVTVSPRDKIDNDKSHPLFKSQEIISLESSEQTLLGKGRISIIDYDRDYIAINDRTKLGLFSLSSGNSLAVIDASGQGSKEYLEISDALVNPQKEEITVLCTRSKKLLSFGFNGKFRQEMFNDSISTIEICEDQVYTCRNPFKKESFYNLSIYDSQWSYLKGMLPVVEEGDKKKDIFTVHDVNVYNNKPYLYIDGYFYQIENQELKPHIHMDRGTYAIPEEVFADIKRKKERYNYIWGDYGKISGDYIFYRYYFEDKVYSDIYSIESNKLLYRNIATSPDDPIGFPVEVLGKNIYVWPKYVKKNKVFAILDEVHMEELNITDDRLIVLKLEL